MQSPKLVVFDLDGTIAPTKSPMDAAMGRLLERLLEEKKVAVIGGGKYALFKMQMLSVLKVRKELLGNLYLFPTTATAFYRYDRGWKNVYTLTLSKRERAAAIKAFRDVVKEVGYKPEKVYGKMIEDRRTQVTFSTLGQDVVAMLGKKKGVALKEQWKREHTPLKMKMAAMVQKRLPKLEVHAAGYTSIDVTKKGIDKGYGVRKISKMLRVPMRDMVFIGDALFPGGNDYAARATGVRCIAVKDPEETKKIIRKIIGA